MAAHSIKVLHVDASHEWRGGQQQVSYLVKGLVEREFYTGVACPNDSPLADFCRQNHITLFPLDIKSEFDVAAAWRLARLCRKNKFTILHAHDAHSFTIAIFAKILCPRLGIIAARRVDFSVKKPLVGSLKYTNRFVDHIITVSEQIRNILIRDGVSAEKITTVHSGVDIHKFDDIESGEVRREFGIPDDHFLVGTVAAIAGHKDYPTLLQAAKIIEEKVEDISFLAVGTGPDEDDVKLLAEELGLEQFYFAGFRTNVGQFLKSFDAFVLSSKTEGLGTSLLDAQAVGLPIVATTAGGIPEIVQDGLNGYLVPPQNAQILAQKILELKMNSSIREQFSQNNLRMVKEFDVARTVEKTIKVYKSFFHSKNQHVD